MFSLIFFLVLPLINAIDLRTGLTINTTISNSSVTFNRNTTADRIEISPYSVYLINITGRYGFVCTINHTTENSNLDSSRIDCISTGPGGAGLRAMEEEVVEEIVKEEREIELQNIIIRVIIWILLIIIFLAIVFITDIMRRNKKIDLFIEMAVIIISALLLFITGWIVQDLILGQSIKITIGITIIAWAIAVIILIMVAFVTDIMRRKKQIGIFLQLIAVVLVGIALYISGSIIQDIVKDQPIEVTLAVWILIAIALFLIILGAIVQGTRRKKV